MYCPLIRLQEQSGARQLSMRRSHLRLHYCSMVQNSSLVRHLCEFGVALYFDTLTALCDSFFDNHCV